MKVLAPLVALTLSASMAGCSRLQEAAMPIVDKVNAAHPVSPEVRLAQERLLAMLADDTEAVDTVHALARSRMTLRALTCSKDQSIGRFDSVAAVKKLQLDTTCFQGQDSEMQTFYGIRTIGVLLAMPALRPLKAAGAIAQLPKGKLSNIIDGALARDAGIGVLMDSVGAAMIAEMPGAKPIAQLPRVGPVTRPGTKVSPNGRVVVVNSSGQGLLFLEAETGTTVWNAGGGFASRLLSWLPEVNAFVLGGFNGQVMLADGLTGSLEPHPLALPNSAYAAHIPGSPARLLIGTARELILLEHARTPGGIVPSPVTQYMIEAGPGITSGHPVPMLSGRMVVYASVRDIGWLNLDSGASGTWRTAPVFGIPFAKLDETHIMFDSSEPGSMSLKPWSFDIANETVAPIDLGEPRGLIVDIGDRIGFLRRGNAAWFGDQVATGEVQPLTRVVAEGELQRQLLKLQALTSHRSDTMPATERPAGGLEASGRASQTSLVPGLAGVPADAEVHIVGVYEGQRRGGRFNEFARAARDVRIVARTPGRPMVLVLASYEPVNWLVADGGARISAVLLSGYHASTATGLGNVPVLRIGSAYAYSAGSPEYLRLRQAVAQYTGAREIRSFQGSYEGVEFTVGGP
jgi:hypothetical protein